MHIVDVMNLRYPWTAMAELDITFRRLLRDLPQPMLHLAFPHRSLEPLGPLDPSVDRTRQLTTDNMLRAIAGSTEVVVHVEVERDWRPKLADRLFDYASAAVTATRLPVWSVVVLLRPGGHPPEGTGVYQVPGADGDAFVFRYQVVSLWQLDARQMQAQLGPSGAPFCAAMQGADEAFIRELVEKVGKDLYGVNFQNHQGKILTGRPVWVRRPWRASGGTARRSLLAGVPTSPASSLRAVAVGVDGLAAE
jgi:hypothetical protein